jgi:hypothetical protein
MQFQRAGGELQLVGRWFQADRANPCSTRCVCSHFGSELLAKGLSNKMIARALGVTEGTVRTTWRRSSMS